MDYRDHMEFSMTAPTRIGRKITKLTVIVVGLTLAASMVSAQGDGNTKAAKDWCGTQRVYNARYGGPDKMLPACDVLGDCDNPSIRNLWIPDDSEPTIIIRMVIHVLASDNGSNPISSESEINANVAHLNEDFLPVGVHFDHTINHVNSSAWRYLSENEIGAMKAATAILPDSQLNVWVTYVNYDYSFGTFPWDGAARTAYGGIVMGHFHWGSSNSVFAHEVGHCLGLYHTFNGVDEVTECGPCYEFAQGDFNDVRGDRCQDTPPGPLYYQCGSPGGVDCMGTPWGNTQPQNYMSYAPHWCYNLFTSQQQGRLRCWTKSALPAWIIGVDMTAENTFGPAPLEVTFNATSTKAINEWQWDFGDGEASGEQAPVHVYEQAGYYDVSVTVQTDDGPYQDVQPGLVMAHADTLRVDSVVYEASEPLRVNVYAINHIPIREIVIPFTWAGPLGIEYDSFSTAGLRTDYFTTKSHLHYSRINSQSTIILRAYDAGTGMLLAPGDEPVATLYFSPPTAQSGVNPVVIAPYLSYKPVFKAEPGNYEPATEPGVVSTACCFGITGNVDCDPEQVVDIGDVTELIALLFIRVGDPFCCEDEVDLDYNSDIDVGDLTILINRLFITVTDPPPCP